VNLAKKMNMNYSSGTEMVFYFFDLPVGKTLGLKPGPCAGKVDSCSFCRQVEFIKCFRDRFSNGKRSMLFPHDYRMFLETTGGGNCDFLSPGMPNGTNRNPGLKALQSQNAFSTESGSAIQCYENEDRA